MNKYKSVPNIRFKGFEDEWKNLKLGELSEIARGASPRPINNKKWFSKDSKIGWLRISDVTEQNGRIFYLKQKLSIQGQKKTRVIKTKHLLLSIAATVGSPVINYIPTGVHDGFLIFYNPKFDIEFMFQWLQKYRKNWSKFGQPGSQVNLNSEIVRNQKVYIPEEKEERYIANLFLKIDRSLNLQQQKIDKLELLKKALLQKLFPKYGAKIPELRFKEFKNEWEKEKLKGYIEKVSGNDGRMNLPTLTISAAKGWMNQNERFSNNIAGKEQKNYTLLKKGELSYNHGNSKLFKYGVVYELINYDEALVPKVYHSFRVNSKASARFIEYLFRGKKVDRELRKLVTSGARMDGLLNINFNNFENIQLYFPEKAEQQKIGNLLSKVDQLIELENKKLQDFQQVKKCLLQNMFVE